MRLESSPLLFAKGYGWLPDARRARGRRTVGVRLGGLPTFGIEGPDAARFLYDEDHVHRVRKALFVALLMNDGPSGAAVTPLVERATAAWDDAAAGWSGREIVLF